LIERLSSHPGETGHASQKKHRNTPGAREKSRANQKKLGQSVEQAENHKKARAGRGLETTWEINQYE
jgi:hypothetical protein